MQNTDKTIILQGFPISPGLAEGIIHVHHSLLGPIDAPRDIEPHNSHKEFTKLDDATKKSTNDLLALATRVEKEIDARFAEVFGSHQLILNDPTLKKELQKEITDNLVSASSAVKSVFLRWEKRFLSMESQLSRDKGADCRDISLRLRNALAGITAHPLEDILPDSVLVTSRLLPSDVIFLSDRSISAVLLEYGSYGSHAALFTREMGLPCISKIPRVTTVIPNGAMALVDADTGRAIINPQEKQATTFRKKVRQNKQSNLSLLQHAKYPATTKDGITISVLANVGCKNDTETAIRNGADGIGLYRMEQAYLGRATPPTSSELLHVMQQTLEAAKDHTVCVRLLDIGADKTLPFMRMRAETNPSLGSRGIRLLREYPELLKTHLEALLELAREFDLHILVPMVALPEDIATVKDVLLELVVDLKTPNVPQLGAMIETPAAALSAREIAKYADFMSFGTNDLTQYIFAADRENAAVEKYFDDTSDVVFKLLRMTHDDAPEIPLTVCGELAGRPEHVQNLLRCGIKTLSVAPPLIPKIKDAIRNSYFNES